MKRLNSKELQSFAESLNTISEKTKPEDININMLDMLGPLMKSRFSGGTAGLRDALRKKMIEKGGDPAEVDAYMKKLQQNKTAPEASSDAETKTEPETLAQKNARTQKENEKKLADIEYLRQQRRERNQKPSVSNLPSDLKDTEQKATAAGQKVAGKPMGGLPADYKKTELEAGKTAERSRTGAGLPVSGGGNQGQGSTTKPQLTDQQKVRAEYDRLRYSKDPKERAQAASYGKAMAAAGAAKKNFSGYKSAAELSKPAGNIVKSGSGATLSSAPKNDLAKGSTPIVVNRGTTEKTSYAYNKPVMGSMAQRLQAIRARQGRPQAQPTAQPGVKKPVQSSADAASKVLNNTSDKIRQDAMNTVNKRYASSIDQLATDMMIKNIKKPGNNTVKPTSNTQTKSKPAVTSKPVVTPNQKSSIQQKVDNVKKPVQTGDKPVVKVNPDTSEMELKQKRSKAATDKIKSSLDMS